MKKRLALILCFILGASQAMALCVVVPETDLHMGPGFQYPTSSWKLSVHTPLMKLDSWNDWYKIADVDGDVHWVHASFVIQGYFCSIVKVKSTILRNGPGEQYQKITDSSKYQVFRFVRKQGKWSQVANEDEEGFWIQTAATWTQ